MKRITVYFCISILISSCVMDKKNTFNKMTKVPVANKKDTTLTIHGNDRNDPYYWMNQRDSEDVLAYLGEENAYSKSYFDDLSPLNDSLLNEFENRIDPNEKSEPFYIHGRKFQSESIEGKDYSVLYDKSKDEKTVFLDQNQRAEGHSFYQLASWDLSPNDKYVALGEDYVGRRKYEITFRNNETGEFLKDKIEDTDGSVIWANDNETVFYVRKDPTTLRECMIYKHKLGTDASTDVLVFEEKDEIYYVYAGKTKDEKFIKIQLYSSTTSETILIDANNPDSAPKVFLPRTKGHMYSLESHDNGFYILSNKDAKNYKLVHSVNWPTTLESCTDVIAHSDSVLLEDFDVFKNYVVCSQRENGLQKLTIINVLNNERKQIEFEEETYTLSTGVNEDFDTSTLFFRYNSLSTPSTLFAYNMVNNSKEEFFSKKLIDPSFSPTNYTTERVWATANDGTKIPISLIYKKGIDTKKAPLLLYGYGSYGYTISPGFSPYRFSLIDRGFVYAIAHVRGGKYMGEDWYNNGKFQHKINTFTDFINAADYLDMKGYCDGDKIYAQGGSAGGLLMGAVMNIAPYRWKGIVSQVPFVDVVTTMLDESIPLTVGEFEEWGNPKDEAYYYYMLNYSPYDNIKRMDYPSVLVTTGYHDSQVQYWEPAKWVARLRELKTDNNVLLFDCNMDAGHGGGSGRTTARKEVAQVYSFLLNLEEINE